VTVTVLKAERCTKLPVKNLSICLVGKARGGLTSAKGNRSSVFTFMKAAKKPEYSPYEDFCFETNKNSD